MNKKTLALIAAVIPALLLANIVLAQEPAPLLIWPDRPDYSPGETGTLSFAFRNVRGGAMTIKKVVIVFDSWRAYRNGQYEGNQTIEVNKAFATNEVFENSTRFTVPSDGRAKDTVVEITFVTGEFGDIDYTYSSISVVPTPRFMDQIVTLFTIQVVLIIVATAIIAATIFLSARRPAINWKTEEPK